MCTNGEKYEDDDLTSDRSYQTPKSLVHEMTQLSRDIENVAFLSWAKPSTSTPEYMKKDKAI
jgi:aminotransferase